MYVSSNDCVLGTRDVAFVSSSSLVPREETAGDSGLGLLTVADDGEFVLIGEEVDEMEETRDAELPETSVQMDESGGVTMDDEERDAVETIVEEGDETETVIRAEDSVVGDDDSSRKRSRLQQQ